MCRQKWADFYNSILESQQKEVERGTRLRKDLWTLEELKAKFSVGGGFYAIDASMPIEAQVANLHDLMEKGAITSSPEPSLVCTQLGDGQRVIAWSTDHLYLSEAASVMCFDALLQAMSGLCMEVRSQL